MIEESNERCLYHIFAVDTYCEYISGRFGSIMVEADKTKAFAQRNGLKSLVWFAKALRFVRINYRRDISVKSGTNDRISSSDAELIYKDEMALVRWYEMLDHENLPLGEIDSAFECVSLRWQRTCGPRRYLASAAAYGLIPLGSVRGLVHTVRTDFAFDNLKEANPRKIIESVMWRVTGMSLTLLPHKSVS